MKTVILITFLTSVLTKTEAQTFCFVNETAGFYSNSSSGAIYDVASQDFNSDGHLDIVTANSQASNISFVPGDGNGALGIATTIPISDKVLFAITSGDYNSDNLFDIAVANEDAIFVLLGNGDGTFQPYNFYPAQNLPSRIYSKDINNDNVLDLVEAGSDGISILLGQGDGTFLPNVQYLSGIGVMDIAIADFDGDSILDIVSTTHLSLTVSELSFLKGNGDGSFASSTQIVSMQYPNNFIAGITSEDIDTDGKMDLIVVNSKNGFNRVEIYFGNDNGTFNSPIFYSTIRRPFYIYLDDINNDFVKDIIVEASNGFSILKGNNDGTFDTGQYIQAISTTNSLAIGDFNEDGKIDVIAPSAYFGSPLITVMINCDPSLGIDETQLDPNSSITVFPNPSKKYFTINSSMLSAYSNIKLKLFNSIGQLIKEEIILNTDFDSSITINTSNINSGNYFFNILNGSNLLLKGKVIIN